MEKVTVIVTILNEERTLPGLFASLESQTKKPDEVIISDGGSTDNSLQLLKSWKPVFPYHYLVKRGNRSVGRNAAIKATKNKLIAITDAGCIPSKDWLQKITSPLQKDKADVVAGYYQAKATTKFEQAASAYMLVMPENVDENNFLPATRSMAMTRRAWEKAGGFDEQFSHNEDYVFAHELRRSGARLTFVRDAVVSWTPPSDWQPFLKQISRFAYGDAAAKIWRPKVLLIFFRWAVFIAIGFINLKLFIAGLSLYCLWAFAKNRKHVPGFAGFWLLPRMQIATDWVVMASSLMGLFRNL